MPARRATRRGSLAHGPAQPQPAAPGDGGIDAWLARLDHPLEPALQALRAAILGADPRIAEGVKWNAMSFRTVEWFATARVHRDEVLLILHLGARVKGGGGLRVEDPSGRLQWLAPDRAALRYRDLADVRAGRKALQAVVRQWLEAVRQGAA